MSIEPNNHTSFQNKSTFLKNNTLRSFYNRVFPSFTVLEEILELYLECFSRGLTFIIPASAKVLSSLKILSSSGTFNRYSFLGSLKHLLEVKLLSCVAFVYFYQNLRIHLLEDTPFENNNLNIFLLRGLVYSFILLFSKFSLDKKDPNYLLKFYARSIVEVLVLFSSVYCVFLKKYLSGSTIVNKFFINWGVERAANLSTFQQVMQSISPKNWASEGPNHKPLIHPRDYDPEAVMHISSCNKEIGSIRRGRDALWSRKGVLAALELVCYYFTLKNITNYELEAEYSVNKKKLGRYALADLICFMPILLAQIYCYLKKKETIFSEPPRLVQSIFKDQSYQWSIQCVYNRKLVCLFQAGSNLTYQEGKQSFKFSCDQFKRADKDLPDNWLLKILTVKRREWGNMLHKVAGQVAIRLQRINEKLEARGGFTLIFQVLSSIILVVINVSDSLKLELMKKKEIPQEESSYFLFGLLAICIPLYLDPYMFDRKKRSILIGITHWISKPGEHRSCPNDLILVKETQDTPRVPGIFLGTERHLCIIFPGQNHYLQLSLIFTTILFITKCLEKRKKKTVFSRDS